MTCQRCDHVRRELAELIEDYEAQASANRNPHPRDPENRFNRGANAAYRDVTAAMKGLLLDIAATDSERSASGGEGTK